MKKPKREGKQARKREEEESSSSEEVAPSRKCMRGIVLPEPVPAPQVIPPAQATPRRESGQSAQSPSVNVDNFIDLETLNRMIDEDNAKAARRAELERERERKEAKELEAAKAESLREAKEEKKRRKAEMRTKHRQEGTSTSTAPHSSLPKEQPLPTPQKTHEEAQSMQVDKEKVAPKDACPRKAENYFGKLAHKNGLCKKPATHYCKSPIFRAL